MADLAPTTKLEAVNILLSTVNESPIQSLLRLSNVHAAVAVSTLDEVSRSLQSEGWHWNTDCEFPLARDENNKIPLPVNTLWVDSDGTYKHLDVVQRGDYLYDREDHSYLFDSSITVTIRFLLDWTELPEPARRLITMRSARMFQARVLGSQVLNQFTESDEMRALTQLKNMENEIADRNLLRQSSIYNILSR